MPISPPVMTAADNADGTGLTVTLTGGDPAAANAVYSQKVTGRAGAGAWAPGGSRVGPGTLAVALGPGWYWLKCESSLGGETVLSNLAYQRAGTGAEEVYEQILQAVKARLLQLDLPGIGPRVYDRTVAPEQTVDLPCVILSVEGGAEQEVGGTNLRDDIDYPVNLTFAERKALEAETPADRRRRFRWRQDVARAFRNQRLDVAGPDPVYFCEVRPRQVVDERFRQFEYAASAMVLVFTAREPRGMGA